jgi:hypothetical protein
MLFECAGTSLAFAQVTEDDASSVAAPGVTGLTNGGVGNPTTHNPVTAQHMFSLLSLAINTCNAKSHQSSCSELLHASFKRSM